MHTQESLEGLSLAELRQIYKDVGAKKPFGSNSRQSWIDAILAKQSEDGYVPPDPDPPAVPMSDEEVAEDIRLAQQVGVSPSPAAPPPLPPSAVHGVVMDDVSGFQSAATSTAAELNAERREAGLIDPAVVERLRHHQQVGSGDYHPGIRNGEPVHTVVAEADVRIGPWVGASVSVVHPTMAKIGLKMTLLGGFIRCEWTAQGKRHANNIPMQYIRTFQLVRDVEGY